MRLASSGKTTYAQALEGEGYLRLSIDEVIWELFGAYGVDYPAADYDAHSRDAQRVLDARLIAAVRDGHDVVVDSSLWQRSRRDQLKRLVADAGGHWRLVYLRVDEAVLRERLAMRATRFDAHAAFPITEDILQHYLAGFEEPDGEGEEVINVADGASSRPTCRPALLRAEWRHVT